MKRLEKYMWGLGIEHEMHVFHRPKFTEKKNIENFTLFNSEKVIEKLKDESENSKGVLTENDKEFLKTVPFETSGRKCNDEWVIKMVPIKMPEFVTNNPFCSIKLNRSLLNMTNEIILSKEKYFEILKKDKETNELIKKYGELSEFPFGMTRYLRYPINVKNNTYEFDKNKEGKTLLVPEYNGSYHVTFTLPYTTKTTNKRFIKNHQNFANQLQWLEPLMLSGYFTGDEYSPGSLDKRVRGSFRVMIIGWGNFAGSDIRLFNKGIGRYAKTETYWRKGLKFIDSDKLKPCLKPSPVAKKEGAFNSLSSDFRTFGSTDPLRPWHRESGVPMTKPNGIEFRIFDQFPDKYIEHLILFISLVAENSRLVETKGYVYKNKIWIKELHNIMKNGYKARLSKSYIKLLREKLGLKIKTKSIIANDIFKIIIKELFKKNIKGEWSRIFHSNYLDIERLEKIIDIYPDINKKGWFMAFMLKLNKDKKLLSKFNKLIEVLNKLKKISFENYEKITINLLGKNWKDDLEDIVYFFEFLNLGSFKKNEDGTIKSITIDKKYKYDNFNKKINSFFEKEKLNLNLY
jgi:hypothetical protein